MPEISNQLFTVIYMKGVVYDYTLIRKYLDWVNTHEFQVIDRNEYARIVKMMRYEKSNIVSTYSVDKYNDGWFVLHFNNYKEVTVICDNFDGIKAFIDHNKINKVF